MLAQTLGRGKPYVFSVDRLESTHHRNGNGGSARRKRMVRWFIEKYNPLPLSMPLLI
jgi:hypothetical protein